jgi:hypothetical protein
MVSVFQDVLPSKLHTHIYLPQCHIRVLFTVVSILNAAYKTINKPIIRQFVIAVNSFYLTVYFNMTNKSFIGDWIKNSVSKWQRHSRKGLQSLRKEYLTTFCILQFPSFQCCSLLLRCKVAVLPAVSFSRSLLY